MMKLIPLLIVLWVGVAPGGALAEGPAFEPTDLDRLIEQSAPTQGQAEIFRPRAIRIEAEVVEPPGPRKSAYLLESLSLWGVDPLPEVHDGLRVRSTGGESTWLYLEAKAAEHAKNDLRTGETATFFGYHVYNTKYGPGILVSDFEVHEVSLVDRIKTLLVKGGND